MKRNRYFINLTNRKKFHIFTIVIAFNKKEAGEIALEKFKIDGYDMIESIIRVG